MFHLFVEQPVIADRWQAVRAQGELIVRGWAFSDDGVERVEITLDGKPAAVLATRIVREDVMAALGGREDALRSGFEAHLAVGALTQGPHLVEVRATTPASVRSTNFFVEAAPSAKPSRALMPRKRARNAKRRALFIDAATPTPDQDAGSKAAIAHMRVLQSLGYAVTFAPVSLLPAGRDTRRLQALGIEAIYLPHCQSLEHLLESRGAEFDLAYVHRHTVGEIAIPLLRRHAARAKIVFNNADLHYLRLQREAEVTGDRALARAASRVKKRELAVIRESDCTLLCNSVELALVRKQLPTARLNYLPWVIDAGKPSSPSFGKREGIAFLGGFGHRPNVDAVKWFVGEVMPLLRKKRPGLKLHIYGSKITRAIESLAAADVIVEGFATDLDRLFERHRLSVVPLRFGAGFKGKLAESLARGVPAVVSAIALEGTGLRARTHVLVADSARGFASAVAKLDSDAAMWKRLSAAGRRYVKENYSFERAKRSFSAMLKAIGAA